MDYGETTKSNLLIVEDDADLIEMLYLRYTEQGFHIFRAGSVAQALQRLQSKLPDLALLDYQLPDGTGLELLSRIKDAEPDLPIVMMTATHNLELAIQAIQKGAFDFIHKPIQFEELDHVLNRVLQHRRLTRNLSALRNTPKTSAMPNGTLLGQSKAMLKVSKEIAMVAESNARVLITGESGTGKEVVARTIHSYSFREGPFLAVNCAAIVDNLLESELFGHEKGAFTSAVARKLGKFELATYGTLFLDEIAELSLLLQAKLLRVLQEGNFERVGGVQQIETQARIIAATNRDLLAEANSDVFRQDLLYRLNVFHIHLPPLRERPEDIPLLVSGLMTHLSRSLHRPALKIPKNAMARLLDYDWPGNVRELENVLTQALIRARGRVLTPDLLHLETRVPANTKGQPEDPFRAPNGNLFSLEDIEARHIQRVLDDTNGHKSRSSEILGISRPSLERKIKKYALHIPGKTTG